MGSDRKAKRAYGTGSMFPRGESWYGQWRESGRLVKRQLGRRRQPGTRAGLTKLQAERELQRLRTETVVLPPEQRLSFAELGEAYMTHLETVRGLKPTTLSDYRSILRQLGGFFGAKQAARLGPDDFYAYIRVKRRDGLKPKTITNHLNFASGCFTHAVKRRWVGSNPLNAVERPRGLQPDGDIRFLVGEEVEALLRAVPEDMLASTDRTLYRTATMAGLRQGELLALRWCDVDWTAGVIRVRRSITRGRIGPPKSRRGSRAVPLADRLARELERHFRQSRYRGDEDLVLCHPETGRPYDASKQRKRFKAALKRAGLREIRVHDLRHTFGTGMAAVGVPMRTLQEMMGHEDIQTTMIYAAYAPQPERERQWAELAFGSSGADDAALEAPQTRLGGPESARRPQGPAASGPASRGRPSTGGNR